MKILLEVITLLAVLLPNSCIGASETQTQKLQHGTSIIVSVRFTLDGKRHVSASSDGTVIMWDAQTGRRVWEVDLDDGAKTKESHTTSQILDMDLSPDGNTVAVAYDRSRVVGNRLEGKSEYRIGLLDARDGRERQALTGHTAMISGLAFSSNGQQLASVSNDQTARLWNVSTGQQVLSINLKERGSAVALSPDGKFLAIAIEPPAYLTPPEPMIELYDVQSGKLVRGFPRRKRNVSDLAFTPDGRMLAIASSDLSGAQTDLWELNAQQPTRTLTDHEKGITSIAFSPDGRLLASGELRNGRGIVVVRDLLTNGQPRTYKLDAGVSALDFSPDGTRLAVGTDKGQIALLSLQAQ